MRFCQRAAVCAAGSRRAANAYLAAWQAGLLPILARQRFRNRKHALVVGATESDRHQAQRPVQAGGLRLVFLVRRLAEEFSTPAGRPPRAAHRDRLAVVDEGVDGVRATQLPRGRQHDAVAAREESLRILIGSCAPAPPPRPPPSESSSKLRSSSKSSFPESYPPATRPRPPPPTPSPDAAAAPPTPSPDAAAARCTPAGAAAAAPAPQPPREEAPLRQLVKHHWRLCRCSVNNQRRCRRRGDRR